eukprot:COSAG02_NODE_579_length_20073_cov_2118.572745_14_plen_238_part_00
MIPPAAPPPARGPPPSTRARGVAARRARSPPGPSVALPRLIMGSSGLWTEEHCAELYDNGYLILRGAVQPELVAPARAALESGAGGSAPEVLALLYESMLEPFLCEGLRGGGFNKVEGSQAGANGPREPGTRCMQTGWPEVDVPFYGWCGHVDGIWSGGASAPNGRDDPDFDPDKFYSEPAVNGHMLEYGEHEGCGVNLQLFSALVGVALSEQQMDGAGQIGVLVSSTSAMLQPVGC